MTNKQVKDSCLFFIQFLFIFFTLKKEMKMCDWDVTKRDKASMVEKPPVGFKLLIFLEMSKVINRNFK